MEFEMPLSGRKATEHRQHLRTRLPGPLGASVPWQAAHRRPNQAYGQTLSDIIDGSIHHRPFLREPRTSISADYIICLTNCSPRSGASTTNACSAARASTVTSQFFRLRHRQFALPKQEEQNRASYEALDSLAPIHP